MDEEGRLGAAFFLRGYMSAGLPKSVANPCKF